MRVVNLIMTMLLLVSLTGCATIFGDNKRTITVNSNPQGAQVYANGQYKGITPTSFDLDRIWSTSTIQVKMPGYQPITTTITPVFQPVGLFNILFWPGFLIDAATSNMLRIPQDSRNLNYSFVPMANAPAQH